jgi:hypothetical protein
MSIRGFARVGSALSLYGMSRLGSSLSVLDFMHVGSAIRLEAWFAAVPLCPCTVSLVSDQL